MTATPIVSNASPVIAFEQIGQLHLLQRLFEHIVIPPSVAREVAPTVTLPVWMIQQSLMQPIGPQIVRGSLGAGESEAISLALELGARLVILDDRPARRLAQALHLPVIGTVGILLAAKRRSLLAAVRPSLDALLQHDFRISQRLYEQILVDASEIVT